MRKVLGSRPAPQSLNVPKSLYPVAIRNIGILGLPFREFEQILLGDTPLLGAIAQVSPLLSR